MLESPLVPDDSTPGTQALSRPERPLTRRELRERESAETAAAQRAAAIGQHQVAPAVAQAAPVERQTDASWQAVFTPAAAAPAYAAPAAQAMPAAPVHTAPAAPGHTVAPAFTAAPAYPAAPGHSAPAYPAAPAAPAPGALRPRRAAAEVPASQAQSEPFVHAAPVVPAAPVTPAVAATPAVPVVIAAPAPTPQAEPVDHSVDRNSAFSVSRAGSGSEVSAGFDDLFADLGDEPEAATHGGRRADASGRSGRPSRAERKAAKAEKAPKAAKSSRSAADVPPRAVPVVAPEAGPSSTDDFAAVIAASAMTRIPGSIEAPAPAPDSQSPDQFVPTAVWQPSNGVAAAQERPRRSAGADTAGARRSTAREASAPPATAGSPKPSAKRRGSRAGRVARMSSGFAAMSFAALLAVATSVPSLSLLSPADVQAMALERATIGSEPGQQVEITGGTLAQTVQRDGYETQTIDEYARAAGIRPEATFTNNPSGTIQWPFAVGVHIGDRFGYRDCAGCSSDHGGQDFNPGLGAEIQSIADGVVANSTDSGGSLGVVMMIDHIIDGELVTSVYAHMEYDSRRFETGDTVKVGDVIGQTGDTGMSTGPHLHFEIRLGGMSGTKVDPLEWLYANTN